MQPREAETRRDELQLLDVREPVEWDAGHLAGSTHIPMSELPSRVGELDTSHPILAICRSGGRSARVATWLQARGYEAHNLDGGLEAWQREGLPLQAPGDGPGTVA